MKTFFLYLFAAGICILCVSGPAPAQNGGNDSKNGPDGSFVWTNFGNPAFSAGPVLWSRIALDAFDQPYVAYSNVPVSSGMEVMTCTNGLWTQVGQPAFAEGMDVSLALNSMGTPLVAAIQWHMPWVNQASVLEFDGVNFVYLGNQWFSAGDTYHTWIDVSSNGEPWVAYQDAANSNKISVMRYNGNWMNAGVPGFSQGWALNPIIKFSHNDIPYVAFTDGPMNWKASVMKFNGSSWEYVGGEGITPDIADSLSLAFDENDVPYLSFSDAANGWKASVMKFNGSNWEYVGNPGFSAGVAGWTNMGINLVGHPVVAFQDGGHGYKVSVMEFIGGTWMYVGSPGFSPGSATWVSMAVSKLNMRYFVAFADGANSDKIMVMEYNDAEGIEDNAGPAFTLGPNPCKDRLVLRFRQPGTSAKIIQVFNLSGLEVLSFQCSNSTAETDISKLPAGIYCLKVNSPGGTCSAKFIKK